MPSKGGYKPSARTKKGGRKRHAVCPFTKGFIPLPSYTTLGIVAEWLGRGLQNLVQRFDSARYLNPSSTSESSWAPPQGNRAHEGCD